MDVLDLMQVYNESGEVVTLDLIDRVRAEIERLRAIVDHLPQTADGVPITLDMTVYFLRPDGYVSERYVVEIGHLLVGTRTKVAPPTIAMIAPERLYSTREAAEAARTEVGE